jgi:acetaldehyde dehydrogenase (acetylating)
MPSMTLAPGGVGGSVVSDNITVHHLLNIKRVAYPLRTPPARAYEHAPDVKGAPRHGDGRDDPARSQPRRPDAPAPHWHAPTSAANGEKPSAATASEVDVNRIVERVLAELGRPS